MNILKSLLSQDGEYSSKRAMGMSGLITIFICFAYCTFTHTEMPAITEFLAGCCVTLLSVDPVTSIFKSDNK